jgi:hypothetical protein
MVLEVNKGRLHQPIQPSRQIGKRKCAITQKYGAYHLLPLKGVHSLLRALPLYHW